MPSRFSHSSPVGGYVPIHLTSAQASVTKVNAGNAGCFLGPVHVNSAGTSGFSLTLYNGNPASGGTAFATITTAGSVPFALAIDHNLWYTLAVTGTPDVTVSVLDMAV